MIGLSLVVALLLLAATVFNWWRSYGHPFIAGEHRVAARMIVALAAVATGLMLALVFR